MNGIVADGAKRLRKALENEVRREYAPELARAPNWWQRVLIERKISLEVKRRMKNVSSAGSLYFTRRLSLAKKFRSS